jgi:ribosomal protein S18 acetylase RimI-like enzyme
MGVEFSIREATREDYEGLRAAFVELIDMHVEKLPHVFHHPNESYFSKEEFADVLADGDKAAFVAESDGDIIGGIYVRISDTPDGSVLVSREYAYIDRIAIKEPFRHLGAGQALIEEAHEWAASRGLDTVELHVKWFNQKAVRFYEELGYTIKRLEMWRSLE